MKDINLIEAPLLGTSGMTPLEFFEYYGQVEWDGIELKAMPVSHVERIIKGLVQHTEPLKARLREGTSSNEEKGQLAETRDFIVFLVILCRTFLHIHGRCSFEEVDKIAYEAVKSQQGFGRRVRIGLK